MKKAFTEKKVIVVGASSGIGNELVMQLVNNGCIVGATARRIHLLQELQSIAPDKIYISKIDNTEFERIEHDLQNLVTKMGGVDIVIVCSGFGEINKNLNFDINRYTIDLNVTGFTKIADWAIKFFESQGHGQLAALTSIGGMMGSADATAYNASKAYQINYLNGVQKRVRQNRLPIFITDIRPGFVNTEMAKGNGLFWVAPVQKAATQIFTAITKRKKVAYITIRWKLIGLFLKFIDINA